MANWSPDRQQAVQALEVLADERLTLVHCAKCDPEDYNHPADAHSEECPRVAAAFALAEIARQQADLTRLAEVEEKARRVFEFGCSCGAVFDSLEAHANHVALVHTGPDTKEAARE